ncbi:hypothetical protein K501DRAFT_332844 [Backusella circina FSU 941]|nr:hypothetical protein K501DRAFT_332844 [Backusella circina FSU 941]
MTVERQTSSGSFSQLVLLPKIRIGLILLAVLAIGFGSWLETNESVSSCSFKSSLAMHQVFLYRNISSNLTTPDSVTFGLWRHCYIYALNCSCSPVNMKYQPDFSTILQIATEHNAVASISDLSSLSRIIPLILATILSVVALFLTGIANKLGQYLYRRIVSGIVLATMIFLAYTLGSTYSYYSQTSRKVCRDPDNVDILCSNYGIQGEVIVFSIGLGLLFLGFLFWIVTTFSKNEGQENKNEYSSEKRQSTEWTQINSLPKSRHKKRSTAVAATTLTLENEQYYSTQQDELAVWRDVTLFDKDLEWEQEYQENENVYYQQNSYQTKPYSQHHPVNQHTLLSPPPPSQTKRNHQIHGHRSHVAESNKHNFTSTAKKYYNQRRVSRDSALTLTTPQKAKHNSQQSDMYYENERRYRKKTPTNMSPHPFTYGEGRRGSHNVGYTHDNGSSASNSSSGYYQGQQSYTEIPMLQMPPSKQFSQHPLSKKKIKDKRIQSYLHSS